MAENLHNAIGAMSLIDDDPIILPDEPEFRVFADNEKSLLGRLLNPECQVMARMINYMPIAWRLVGKVRGIALSKDRFQFIFDREEDLLTVLKDRPWSYNHWTLLLERWCPSPPRDFLTSLEVWIRIRNIPLAHYTSSTMYTLAGKIGHVEELAYDPKVSQTTDYVRALVTLKVDNPAFEAKNLFLPSGEITVITYEYEKIHKRCFSCFRLTHEKMRCPYAKRKKPVGDQSSPAETLAEPPTKNAKTSNAEVSTKEVPPGFPPLFPELSQEDQRMAIQYVSHADETERRARIQRVRQSIEEAPKVPDIRLRISHDLDKNKGHVFNYNTEAAESSPQSRLGKAPVFSLPEPLTTGYESEASVEQATLSKHKIQGSTVFKLGSHVPSVSTGTSGSKKKDRRRPPAWVRKNRANLHDRSQKNDRVLATSSDSTGKRKADSPTVSPAKKSTKTQDNTVASDLKPLPSQ
ncbi:hypothetical protein Bca4012_066161 [Brassica carinata]